MQPILLLLLTLTSVALALPLQPRQNLNPGTPPINSTEGYIISLRFNDTGVWKASRGDLAEPFANITLVNTTETAIHGANGSDYIFYLLPGTNSSLFRITNHNMNSTQSYGELAEAPFSSASASSAAPSASGFDDTFSVQPLTYMGANAEFQIICAAYLMGPNFSGCQFIDSSSQCLGFGPTSDTLGVQACDDTGSFTDFAIRPIDYDQQNE